MKLVTLAAKSYRRSLLTRLATLYICLVIVVGLGTTTLKARFDDADADGIDDGAEAWMAEHFFPTIHWNADEDCPAPVPRPFLYRVRHPTILGQPVENYYVINYVQLYSVDCGYIHHHAGDNESFLIFVKFQFPDVFQFKGISAIAHEDEVCETFTSSQTNELWIGMSKHGTYADPDSCGCWFMDSCDPPSQTYPHILWNVGEPGPGRSLIDLHDVAPIWSGDPWGPQQFEDAGHIEPQLRLTDHYEIPTWPEQPAPDRDCLDACESTHRACYCCESLDQCDAEFDACNASCYTWVGWDWEQFTPWHGR